MLLLNRLYWDCTEGRRAGGKGRGREEEIVKEKVRPNLERHTGIFGLIGGFRLQHSKEGFLEG